MTNLWGSDEISFSSGPRCKWFYVFRQFYTLFSFPLQVFLFTPHKFLTFSKNIGDFTV